MLTVEDSVYDRSSESWKNAYLCLNCFYFTLENVRHVLQRNMQEARYSVPQLASNLLCRIRSFETALETC